MERYMLPVAIVAMAAVVVISVAGATQTADLTANEYRTWSRTAQLAYVIGFVDGLYGARFPETTNRILDCIEHRMPYSQLFAIVQKYVAEHPEEWHDRIAQLAIDALYQGVCR